MHVIVGSSAPVLPTGIEVVNITAYSAKIMWRVPYLAYTQEYYKVKYGLSEDSLNKSIQITSSATDGSNMSYNATLLHLTPNTIYFFQINSSNSQGVTLSPPRTLKTLETGKLIVVMIGLSQLSS